jgi:peptide/nickel transport system permease protein
VGTRGYVLKKVAQALLTLFFVLIFNFFLFRILPGNPVQFLTRVQGAQLNVQEQQQLIKEFGLDKSLPAQFVDYVGDVATFNLGVSTVFDPGNSVGGIILERLWRTVILVGVATIISTVIGLLMGIYGGWKRGGAFDNSSMVGSLILYSMPEFFLGMLLILLFSSYLGLFPSSGISSAIDAGGGLAGFTDYLNHLFLPMLTLILAYLGEYYLIMRSSLLDTLGEDFITTARAKGVREKWVLRRHAVRNALLPTITLIALSFGFVLGGAITVETVFSYPGLGGLTYSALTARDSPVLQGVFLLSSAAVIFANLFADLIYGYFDPRVREA